MEENLTKHELDFLRKQAWDYFAIHAAQRMAIFNFYIVLSSLTLTTYFASFKADSNLEAARPALASLLCLFAFIFWKLDSRTKFLIKNAERALRRFEQDDNAVPLAKVFTQEELETAVRQSKGWKKTLPWTWHLSYSNCFNCVFTIFFVVGLVGIAAAAIHWYQNPAQMSGSGSVWRK